MDSSSNGDAYDAIEQMLSALFGADTARDAVAALRASGMDASDVMAMGGLPDMSSMTPQQLSMMRAQIQQLMNPAAHAEGVNWQIGRDIALNAARSQGDPVVTAAQAQEVEEALRVADLWLDVVTDFMPAPGPREAWTRSQWIERTIPTWKQVCAPVAQAAVDVLAGALKDQTRTIESELAMSDDDPTASQMARQLGALGSVVSSLAGTAFGMQLGTIVGQVGVSALSCSDVGLPLSKEPGSALVPANVADFAQGLDASESEVRMFLAVREAATARLYAHVPWLSSQILKSLESFSREIHVDVEAVHDAVAQVDPGDPQALREALESGMFMPEESPVQREALEHLETWLALVEGWVEVVTARAVAPHLPHAVPLQEMLRRRRLAGGAAEQVFSRLVGMEFRPRRVREAAQLWTLLGQEVGDSERDAFWQHPDVMPTAQELAAPADFLTMRRAAEDLDSDIDADLASLLDGTLGYADGARQADAGETDSDREPEE